LNSIIIRIKHENSPRLSDANREDSPGEKAARAEISAGEARAAILREPGRREAQLIVGWMQADPGDQQAGREEPREAGGDREGIAILENDGPGQVLREA
jgi:hypothetical protein